MHSLLHETAFHFCHQRYYVCMARGDQKDRIKRGLVARYDAADAAMAGGWYSQLKLYLSGGAPDGDYDTQISYCRELNTHRKQCGFGLYNLLGIEKSDAKGRSEQVRRNFEFFDAPVVFFVFVHGGMGPFSPLDVGFYLQTLLL